MRHPDQGPLLNDLRPRLEQALSPTYRIERELGGGGMSRVFVAEEVDLGRRVIIKVLPPEMAASVNVERFRLSAAIGLLIVGLPYLAAPGYVEGQRAPVRARLTAAPRSGGFRAWLTWRDPLTSSLLASHCRFRSLANSASSSFAIRRSWSTTILVG
ncbi:MAG: hypothetical protein HYW06_02985 [Gemmatimonadetes bacterium]|nr:hypothetical protein [Gemmatimonadota bacterium]MBI2403232.1 hypothetical protein [Gemmatimonadota bacterium]MBI2535937.1 hypothetical protein [Gemmatimonadota bacterium]